MGSIMYEVQKFHLTSYPDEHKLLIPFLNGFSVTWGKRQREYNSDFSVYFLNPEPSIKEAYGFNQELMLVYSLYRRMEVRTIKAAEKFINDNQARGRVEQLTYFLLSDSDSVHEWVKLYLSKNPESRIIITISTRELVNNQSNNWFIRDILSQQLYERDFFDYRLPLEKDTYFFGRKNIVASYLDVIRQSENRGLFGLRKTGKTSILYKLTRIVTSEKIGHFFFYDCKLPSIRQLRWFELMERIIKDICQKCKIKYKGDFDERRISDTFVSLIREIFSNKRRFSNKPIILVFDDIEFISPKAIIDKHWRKDFIDFWQTIWACQSMYRNLSTIICGVNPNILESDNVDGVQNPIFGIAPYQYLRGLEFDEMERMVTTLGSKMGLQFDTDTLSYLYDRYGGHPLLTRIACSLVNSTVKISGQNRPIRITKERLLSEEDSRDSDLMFYCRHVVSELLQFYPDEYKLLELLASRQVVDFLSLASYPESTKHLESYGLLSKDRNGTARISIPVVERYIGLEFARKEGRQTIYKVTEPSDREAWLKKRIESIVHDIRFLEKQIERNCFLCIFGPNSFPEPDKFARIRICNNEDDFDSFINICNRCFVESIENYGLSISKRNYFWEEIKRDYSGLWYALHRIKVYRHYHFHIKLMPDVNEHLLSYLKKDLEGKSPGQVEDLYFTLQQCVLDGLLTGIQMELNKLG